MKNKEIARLLRELGIFLELQGVAFKPQAYERAAEGVTGQSEDVATIYKKGDIKALESIPGVGRGIAEKIEEYLKTGRIKEYQQLKKKYPLEIEELSAVEGVGAKTALELFRKLGIKNLAALERAARAGKIHALPGFGKKSEEKIIKGIEFLKQGGGRFALGEVLPEIKELQAKLAGLKETKQVVMAGSVRRWKETIGDIDILATSEKPEVVMDFFVSMPEVVNVYAYGKTKSMVRLQNGLDADLRVVPSKSFGAALNYFTGSKEHNVALRELAIKGGFKLNEYGLFRGKKQIAGKSEEELYRALGLTYIPPELRENTGEIEISKQNKLPKLIGYNDLRGDLQIQTDWTDGKNSIKEMALEAKRLGHKYLLITDHTKTLAMTDGSDEKKLLRQMAAIDKLNRELGGKPTVLKGAEVNILKDGTLDIEDRVLAKLDVCAAAVHSHFNLPRVAMTARIKRVMQNPHVDIIFHPTGRVLNRRPAYEVDMETLLNEAKETKTMMEINASPDRLDLKDEHIRMAVAKGVKLAINTDAHAVSHMSFLEFGIAQARRGWAEKKDVINAWPLKKMLGMFK